MYMSMSALLRERNIEGKKRCCEYLRPLWAVAPVAGGITSPSVIIRFSECALEKCANVSTSRHLMLKTAYGNQTINVGQ
jgi:hypothetical protein